ncbi:hypothetical protein GUITHDRAFT_107171 [Guillardia theta CCMP2712]|uniref:Nudix hydrolase domain-containing protein n=1 Tax=Guillardia theta (strain CCMP2712) TaxID=905079 RepID=L1JFB4_GUITC|nr:hypothetical protein GUITHDRAFT_107171 [Guillardia theta CCMP2712]EKX46814.1 hypothetical protein GUITHDRAFT_107171 [Guillardia theta CCMP2712]|eukprot:XP_005833794.1 hypothetical protein GUITHDRAFT_107171 [Guillardia theta CCMP2712]
MQQEGFEVLKEEQIFHRYLTIIDRVVKYPNGKEVKFDVLTCPSNHFVTALAFFTSTKQFAVIKEYFQGVNRIGSAIACGRYEPSKHNSILHAAECELSEECALKGGKWIKLIPDGHPGVIEAKWAATRFTPFLVIDPEEDENPLEKDEEEYMHRASVEFCVFRYSDFMNRRMSL